VLAWPARRRRELNPYGALLYDRLEAEADRIEVEDWTPLRALLGSHELWHVHFPDALVSVRSTPRAIANLALFSVLLVLARLRGTHLVWTVHDLESAESWHPRLADWLERFLVRHVDGVCCLSRTAHESMLERRPSLRGRPHRIVPHGHYRGAYPDEVSREEARRRLGVSREARCILFFGRIRRYKNVPALVEAFRDLRAEHATLLIAGEPFDREIESEVRSAAAGDERIRLRLERVAEADVQQLFRAADLVALPYRHILHSGVLLLSLSFDRPVLVPALGSLPEYRERLGEEWVRAYRGALSSAMLAEALEWAIGAPRPERCDLSGESWAVVVRETQALYEEVRGPRGGVGPARPLAAGRGSGARDGR
jgi:beta-1,4-mannosyltransferase